MMMDDDRPKPPRIEVGADLAALSVAELEERAAALEAEVERVRAMLESKRRSRSAADSVFRS